MTTEIARFMRKLEVIWDELTRISRTVDRFHLVDESTVSFTHDRGPAPSHFAR